MYLNQMDTERATLLCLGAGVLHSDYSAACTESLRGGISSTDYCKDCCG